MERPPPARWLAVVRGAFEDLDQRGSTGQDDDDCLFEPKRGVGRCVADLDDFNLHAAVRIEADARVVQHEVDG